MGSGALYTRYFLIFNKAVSLCWRSYHTIEIATIPEHLESFHGGFFMSLLLLPVFERKRLCCLLDFITFNVSAIWDAWHNVWQIVPSLSHLCFKHASNHCKETIAQKSRGVGISISQQFWSINLRADFISKCLEIVSFFSLAD